MVTIKGNVTNMKKRPTFTEESSMASQKDLSFDTHCRNPNATITKF
jgi:hypothetical protein